MATTWTAEKYLVGQNYVYRVLGTHTQGDTLLFTYKATPPTDVDIDLPTLATIRFTKDARKDTDAFYELETTTIVDGGTYYTVSFTIPASEVADWVGIYYFDVEEVLTSGAIQTKITDAKLTVRKDVPNA